MLNLFILNQHSIDPKSADVKGLQDANQCTMAIREAEKAFENQQWDRARNLLTSALRFADHSPSLLLKKAICSFSQADYYETISETGYHIFSLLLNNSINIS